MLSIAFTVLVLAVSTRHTQVADSRDGFTGIQQLGILVSSPTGRGSTLRRPQEHGVEEERTGRPGVHDFSPVHPTGQYSNKYPQMEGHVLHLSARHAKLRRAYRKVQ